MFWIRLMSGIVLLTVAIATFAYGNLFLLLPLWIISLIAYRELTKTLQCGTEGKCNLLEGIGFLGVTAYYFAVWIGRGGKHGSDPVWLLMVITAVFLIFLTVYVAVFPKFKAEQVVAAYFSFIYAPVMLSFVYLTRESEKGFYLVWLILISSWGCDTCAYAVGKLIGKKKIFPVLSPNKSLEGCIGGVLGTAILGAIYGKIFVEPVYRESGMQVTHVTAAIALICAAGALMSMVGDLAASAIKRDRGIKDYGKLIPGHGGIMDRFDSMIITAPMTYILALFFLG